MGQGFPPTTPSCPCALQIPFFTSPAPDFRLPSLPSSTASPADFFHQLSLLREPVLYLSQTIHYCPSGTISLRHSYGHVPSLSPHFAQLPCKQHFSVFTDPGTMGHPWFLLRSCPIAPHAIPSVLLLFWPRGHPCLLLNGSLLPCKNHFLNPFTPKATCHPCILHKSWPAALQENFLSKIYPLLDNPCMWL